MDYIMFRGDTNHEDSVIISRNYLVCTLTIHDYGLGTVLVCVLTNQCENKSTSLKRHSYTKLYLRCGVSVGFISFRISGLKFLLSFSIKPVLSNPLLGTHKLWIFHLKACI